MKNQLILLFTICWLVALGALLIAVKAGRPTPWRRFYRRY